MQTAYENKPRETLPYQFERWKKEIRFCHPADPADRRDVPDDVTFPDDVRSALELISAYLSLPVLADTFDNPHDREMWRNRLAAEDPLMHLIYQSNSLRMNTISSALGGVEHLAPYLQWTKSLGFGDIEEAHAEYIEKVKSLWKKDPRPSTDKKVEYVQEFIAFLHFVVAAIEAIFRNEKSKAEIMRHLESEHGEEELRKRGTELIAVLREMRERAKEWAVDDE